MKSYQIVAWGEPLEERETEMPVPHGREVLVKVDACGVCHSDVHIAEGSFDMGGGRRVRLADTGAELPFTMGHEIVGTVAAVGEDAPASLAGTRVVVYPWIGCGLCRACRAGRDVDCEANRSLGTRVAGGFAEYVLVPDARYAVAYGELDPFLAATCACSVLTAYSALAKLPPMSADDALLIVGAGGVGLAAVGLASAVTPARVAVCDVDDAKLEAARRAGAHVTIDGRHDALPAAVRSALGGAPRAAIDFVGSAQTVKTAIAVTGRGGTVVLVGLFGGSIELATPLLPMKNLTLRGSYVGSLDEMKDVLALVARRGGSVPLTVRPMREIDAILNELRNGGIVGRVVATP